MKTIAIVAAGGVGRRLGFATEKPFVPLRGKPIIFYCLHTLESSSVIDDIVVAVEKSCISRLSNLVRKFSLKKVTRVVAGGRDRFHSVRNCLAIVDTSYEVVLVHDAARPFLTRVIIKETVAAARRYGASLASVPEKDTVKVAENGGFVRRTIDRSTLWRAQTPQAFKRSIIVNAYRNAPKDGRGITDDAMLVERLRKRVKIISGTYNNIKITTKDDLRLADAYLRRSSA